MEYDIAIIGAGFSGLSLCHALAGKTTDRDYRICLIDKRDTCPDLFRAEKIEADQAAIMRDIGTLELRAPRRDLIGEVRFFKDGKLDTHDGDETYGISYSETVNSLADNLPAGTERIRDTVVGIDNSDSLQTVHLKDGGELKAKLVVLATGGNNKLIESLGLRRRLEKKLVSLSVGFDIEREDGSDFDFNGFNYYLSKSPLKVNYITIFPIGERMRVNPFTQLGLKDKLTEELRNNTLHALNMTFPELFKHIGDIKITSRVQIMPTQYYRMKHHVMPGLVVIGDEYQGVNPATGSGLSKVLTDVKTLSGYIPRWLDSGDVSKKNIAGYYRDPDKTRVDTGSLSSWIYYYDDLITGNKPFHERVKHKLKLKGWY